MQPSHFNAGCAHFVETLPNCVVQQVVERMYWIVFLAFTLKFTIETSLSVVPTHSVFWRATQFQQNEHIPASGGGVTVMYCNRLIHADI